jgi:hypothetical protein
MKHYFLTTAFAVRPLAITFSNDSSYHSAIEDKFLPLQKFYYGIFFSTRVLILKYV